MKSYERQFSLILFLLGKNRTREEIFNVLNYTGNSPETIRKKFERDKKIIIGLGIGLNILGGGHNCTYTIESIPKKLIENKTKPGCRISKSKVKLLFDIIHYINTNNGIKFEQVRNEFEYEKKALFNKILNRVLVIGVPPFSPGDYFDLYKSNGKLHISFPTGIAL